MLGNRTLQANPAGGPPVITATGTTTLGFTPGATPFADSVVVSASSAATITLPPIAVTATALGTGPNQVLRIINLNSQSVALAADSTNTIKGASGTIAQNAAATLISDALNTCWYRF